MVWSPFTRVLHWGLAVNITLTYFLEGGDPPHNWAGYLALLFTLIRFIWGLVSKDEANFRNFPISWFSIQQHIRVLLKWQKKDYRGHNPLASWTYILMWLLVIGLTITGYLLGTDYFWGDERMNNVHVFMADFMLVLIALHFIGITIDSYKFKRRRWMGMISGKK